MGDDKVDRQVREGCAKVSDVSQFTGLSRSKIYQLMDVGELAYLKIGRSRRIPWDAVERLLADHIVAARRPAN